MLQRWAPWFLDMSLLKHTNKHKGQKACTFFFLYNCCFRLLSTYFEGLQTVTYYLCIEIILILSLVEMCMTMVLFCVHVLMWHFKWLTFLSFQSSKKSFFCFSYSHSYSVVHHTGFSFCFLLQEGDIFNNNIVYFIDSQVYGDDIYIYMTTVLKASLPFSGSLPVKRNIHSDTPEPLNIYCISCASSRKHSSSLWVLVALKVQM